MRQLAIQVETGLAVPIHHRNVRPVRERHSVRKQRSEVIP